MTTYKGFDRYEGTPSISYEVARNEGFDLVIHKATEGATFIDPTFKAEFEKSKAAGLVAGAYCFARPKTSSAEAEARHYIAVVESVGGFTHALPPILDLEDAETGFTAEEMQTWTRTWLETAHAETGRKPILYCYTAFIEEYGLHVLEPICDLWIADYEKEPHLAGFSHAVLWQTGDKGTVAGVHPVDMDVFYGNLSEYVSEIPTAQCAVAGEIQKEEGQKDEGQKDEGQGEKTSASAPTYGERGAYQLREGETLQTVCGKYNVPVPVLARYNPVGELTAGEWVRIPSKAVIKPGDTLAKLFGSEWEFVARVNAINPDRLWVGQVVYY